MALMSLRDYFAAKALQGTIWSGGSNLPKSEYTNNMKDRARFCYDMADAMLAERDKTS